MNRRRRSLFTKFNLVTVLINLICFMGIGIVFFHHMEAQSNAQTQSFVLDAGQRAASTVSTFTDRFEWNADILSADHSINSFLNELRAAPTLPYSTFVQYKNIGSRFSLLLSVDPSLLSVHIMKEDPYLLSDGQYVVPADALFRPYIHSPSHIVNRWTILDGNVYLLNTPRSSRNSLLVMQLDEHALYQSLAVQSENVDYYLLDSSRIILSSSHRELLGKPLPDSLQNALDAGEISEIEGNILCCPQTAGSLSMLITHDVSAMRSANSRIASRMILMVVFSMLLSILLLWLLSRSISGNIRRILQKLQIMSQGEFVQQPSVRTGDELAQIDSSICELGMNVDRLSRNLVEAVQHQKRSELRFLQMQINRHFLHNSLSSLRWMAVRKGEGELSELMENLIAFYRITLSQDDILTLRDEVKLVENYVSLENVIHLGDLHFHCDIPRELMNTMVCKMTLQPFIENCIHHGKIQGQSLDIWLSAEELAGSLLLRVEDNGHGMSRERVEELQEIFQGKKPGGDSIAIYNTLSRLRGLYGQDVDISIMVRQGTVIEIMIPLQEE